MEVIAAEVFVQRSILEHVIDGGEHRGCDRENRLLAPASRGGEPNSAAVIELIDEKAQD